MFSAFIPNIINYFSFGICKVNYREKEKNLKHDLAFPESNY